MGILPPPHTTPLTPHKPRPVDAKLLQQTLVTVVMVVVMVVVVTMQLKTCNFQHFCKLIVFMKMLILIGFMRYLKTKLQHFHVATLIC